ncbi:hypothetical protein IJV79_02230, partial [bacterium]|nr:hypothetical protein [bacterium]
MKKWIVISVLLVCYLAVSIYLNHSDVKYRVTKVYSPTEIGVDFNRNNKIDVGEVFILKNVLSFSTDLSKNKAVIETLNLSKEDSLRLGYYAENYALDMLEGKRVSFKGTDLYVNNKNYRKMLLSRGYAIDPSEMWISAIEKNLEKLRKIKLVIYNPEDNKYHKLSSEHAHSIKDGIILPVRQTPYDAVECEICHKVKEVQQELERRNFAKLDFKNLNVELILSDMTKTLRPNNKCTDKICKRLVKEIDSAQSDISFAIYGYSSTPMIEEALVRAMNRGVRVRFVYDRDGKGDNIYPHTDKLVELVSNNNADLDRAIMHNKFFIFDDKRVITGSANLSTTDMSGFNSNAILIIDSVDVARMFKLEFEQMYGGKFHGDKSRVKKYNSEKLRVYFSPADNTIEKEIVPLINHAKSYVYVPAFVVTHYKFIQSLIAAKNRGVDVRVILDSTNTRYPSGKDRLRAAKVPVKTENYAGKLHSKSIVIDDRYLIVGS